MERANQLKCERTTRTFAWGTFSCFSTPFDFAATRQSAVMTVPAKVPTPIPDRKLNHCTAFLLGRRAFFNEILVDSSSKLSLCGAQCKEKNGSRASLSCKLNRKNCNLPEIPEFIRGLGKKSGPTLNLDAQTCRAVRCPRWELFPSEQSAIGIYITGDHDIEICPMLDFMFFKHIYYFSCSLFGQDHYTVFRM